MNVISAYLDTMFGAYPSTPRMLEAKAELHTMMEDAYTGYIDAGLSENEAVGRVITEFGNLDELAPVLGIATDIAPATDGVSSAAASSPQREPRIDSLPPITQDEATRYAEMRRRTEPRLALGAAILVVSPAPLISLASLGRSAPGGLDSDGGTLIGLIALLVLVACGVMILVNRNQRFAPFRRVEEGAFTRSPGVELWARSLAAEAAPKRTARLQVAIALWILSLAPIFVVNLLPALGRGASNAWSGTSVAAALVIVAVGLLVFLPANWAAAVSAALAEGGRDPEAASGDERSVVGVIAAFYWPLLTAIFLAWGFIGDAWDRAWIVWPIGAVLFGALAAGLGSWEGYRRGRG